MSETNYERYFGTPEKAEVTIKTLLISMSCASVCALCAAQPYCQPGGSTLEWLKKEAE